jgi:tRNA (guanine-N7-)-methyltransferase
MPGADWRIHPAELREGSLAEIFAPRPSASWRLIVDLGFGRGEFLLALAEKDPDTAYLGVEYSFKRVLKLARRLALTEIRNVRLVQAPAEYVVGEGLPHGSVHGFWINFPDPWPKRRHQKRRLIQPPFVRELACCLAPDGRLHVTTDDPGYAWQIDDVLSAQPALENLNAPQPWCRDAVERPPTAYELAWRAEGRALHFFSYRRQPGATPA